MLDDLHERLGCAHDVTLFVPNLVKFGTKSGKGRSSRSQSERYSRVISRLCTCFRSNVVQKAEVFSGVCTCFGSNLVQSPEDCLLRDTRGKLSLKKAGKILQKP